MLNGTSLDKLCEVGNSSEELKKKLDSLFKLEFKENQIALREEILNQNYSNLANADKLIKFVFNY
ncbi:MAG: hypothetical protein R2764_13510 [Bacteroidales bacterium]